MKKILLTCTDLMAIQFFTEHIKFWHEKGYHIDLACSPVGGRVNELIEFFDSIENSSLRTVALSRSPFKVSNLKGYLQLRKIAKKDHYDFVVTNEPVMGLLTRLAFANKRETKVTYIAHGFHFYRGGSKLNNIIYKAIESFAAHFTDSLVTINKEDFEATKAFKLKKNGTAIILLHNHPSGDPTPSRDDILTTNRVEQAGKLLGLPLHDHIILGQNSYISLRGEGYLKSE